MHPFFKFLKQVQVGDTIEGSAIIHDQPKQHRVTKVVATAEEVNKGSIVYNLSYEKDYVELPLKITLRKFNVSEYGNYFNILYNNEPVSMFFVVRKYFY